MRLNRALTAMGRAVLGASGVGMAWVALSRTVLLPDADGWVAAVLLGAVVATVTVAATVRIPDVWAARAADCWLGSRDRFATAVELASHNQELSRIAARQLALAEQAAAGVHRFPERPRADVRVLGLGAALTLLAAGVGALPNPQDAVRARMVAEQAEIAAQAQVLHETAAALERVSGRPSERALALDLRRLADDLNHASREAALRRLADARADLTGRLDLGRAAERTALAGLARELAVNPLAPGRNVAQQLDALAGQLESRPETADAALAARFGRLSRALMGGSPAVAAALKKAAEAAAAGNEAAAAQAARQASAAVRDALDRLAEQNAVAAADGALAQAEAGLRDGPRPGALGHAHDGEQQGRGQEPGSRLAEGQEQIRGQNGSGLGTGTGGPEPDSQTVFDPPADLRGEGKPFSLDGAPTGDGPESDWGSHQGVGVPNDALVPYSDVLAEYATQAARTIEQPGYPVRLRGTVQDYFDRLSAGQGAGGSPPASQGAGGSPPANQGVGR
jgi:hypothetical protein